MWKEKERGNGWRVWKAETSPKGRKHLRTQRKAGAIVPAGIKQTYVQAPTCGKRLPAATTYPNTGPSSPGKREELRKSVLRPLQKTPSGSALLTGAFSSSAVLIPIIEGLNDKHTCAHTQTIPISPLKKNNLGKGKVHFTGMHNSNRLLLRDGSLG